MQIKVSYVIDIDDARIVDAYNKSNETKATKVGELSEDEIVEAVIQDDDILVDLLGEDFEGAFDINII